MDLAVQLHASLIHLLVIYLPTSVLAAIMRGQQPIVGLRPPTCLLPPSPITSSTQPRAGLFPSRGCRLNLFPQPCGLPYYYRHGNPPFRGLLPPRSSHLEVVGVLSVCRHATRTSVLTLLAGTRGIPFGEASGTGALTEQGWEQARKLGELWAKDQPHLFRSPDQVSVCATPVPRTIESAKAFYTGAFPGATVPAVDLVYNLKPRHPYLEHLRDTFRREDRTSGRPWACLAIQAWDTIESLCANGLHKHLPPMVWHPWVVVTIQRAAHREATRPYTDPEALRLAAGPVMSFLADNLHAMYRKYNEEQIPQFVLFVGHDWNLDAIQWVLKTPSGAWQRHMDPQSLQIKVLRGGGNFFISVSVNGSPVVIPGCAPAVGKGPAVHELHDALRCMNAFKSDETPPSLPLPGRRPL
ncbi:histidine phosphatase superfamily [Plectosphaerella cucumerina]|uniref:Histidine phosphatase superfamily n=1 Tax=Plectosphaerella cucumerina TaxID=40658 RepID=A0A8K0TVE4_9PEZI|nr:histidine phosphatase superfamily [Plectosphaerella cucumerina]